MTATAPQRAATVGDRPEPHRLIASLPLPVLLLTPGLTIAGANPSAEQLIGQGARRMVGRSVEDVLSFAEPLILDRLREGDAHLVARGVEVTFVAQPPSINPARRLDIQTAPVIHHPRWHLLVLTEPPAPSDDGSTTSDEARVRAPDVLAHEIKNPLAGIRGAAQLLGRQVGERERALTGLITSEVDRIAKLIDQMQSLAQRRREPAAPCNLHEAVRRALAVFEAANGQAVTVTEEFDPSLPMIEANRDALVQVVLNLLSNAAEATATRAQRDSRERRIVVRTRFSSGFQLHSRAGQPLMLPIELRVSDNGPGVDPAIRDHMFEPFVTGRKNGQGLGLALVAKLARDMNGQITHDRDETAGMTHFRLHLPLPAARPRSPQGKRA